MIASKLLVAACRRDAAGGALALPDGVDWPRLLDRAVRLGVDGQLRALLERCGRPECVPVEVLERLDALHVVRAARNAALLRALGEVLHRLHAAGVPSIALDGVALAAAIHDDPSLRPIGTLDLLVRESDERAARAVLLAAGYASEGPDRGSAGETGQRLHRLPRFRRRSGRATIRLHRRIAPTLPVAVRAEGFWDRARETRIAEAPARILAPDDLLLHLALHLAGSGGFVGRLGELCDVDATVRRYEADLDWGRFCDTAHWSGAASHGYYALWLARTLLGAPIPPAVFDHLERPARRGLLLDRATKSFARWAALRFVRDQEPRPSGLLSEWGRSLLHGRTWRGRVRAVARSLYANGA